MAEDYSISTPEFTMRNRFEIRGDVTAIFLKQKTGPPLECLIDTADLPMVSRARLWSAFSSRSGLPIYAAYVRRLPAGSVNKFKTIMMHRLVMHSQNPNGRHIDHIHGNGLDNRRSEVRLASRSLNSLNRRKPYTPKKDGRAFLAAIHYQGSTINLGSYNLAIEAQIAHHAASLALQHVEARNI